MSAAASERAALRIGFAGTPDFAAVILNALLAAQYNVVIVYTQPDRRAGRGRKLRPGPVKTLALEHHINVRQPPSLRNDEASDALRECNLDVLVVAAYGLILPESLLGIPTHGCLNVHASLLPRWRGAAPVERAIMAGDEQTGVCIMQMDAGLDTGPVLAQAVCPIGDDTVGSELELALAELGANSLLECLDHLDTLPRQPQSDSGVTYATKLSAADAAIDWGQPARTIHRQIRALRDRQPAQTYLQPASLHGEVTIKILEARWLEDSSDAGPGTIVSADRSGIHIACGEGMLSVQRLQLNQGKGRPLSAADAQNGYPELFTPGVQLAGGS
ncbi:MAG: methionyl-tRNA formyltransferase [Gammaproteobacteria bacterium]|nr:methionyl-tRNA formyltransferase [Gammaproteobacteria bacterium]